MRDTSLTAAPPKRSRLRNWLIAAGVLATIGAIAVTVIATRLGPGVRARMIEMVKERYQSDVELARLDLSLFPRVHATGEGLKLRLHGRTDVPPLVAIGKFSFDADLRELSGAGPTRVRQLRLEGLQIHVPPSRSFPRGSSTGKVPDFVIEEVIADGAELIIMPKKEGKDPLTFELGRLTLRDAGANQPMTFRASLKNAKPPGLIETTGKFGPWQSADPSTTPVSGDYTFRNADLSAFKGISGTLSSDGNFKGMLERIEAAGTTDTPDFTVTGQPVHLKADYQAVIDGTDGDTYLQPVNAHFLHSNVTARGAVEGKPGVKGKTVSLDVDMAGARMEDLLRLIVKSNQPFMTGLITTRSKLIIPPGEVDVVQKMRLSGRFRLSSGKFKNVIVQEKIETLSRRARGIKDPAVIDPEEIVTGLQGRFLMGNSVMKFEELSFQVPGAFIQLAGAFGLRTEELDFHGTARMDAKVSQMTKGWKSLVLKIADPFFAKDGAGAVIPIKITGTRQDPKFGLELRRKSK